MNSILLLKMNNLFQVAPKNITIYKQRGQTLTRILCSRFYSTEQAVKTLDDNEGNIQLQKDFEKISGIYIKHKTKKPQKPPFLKNIFLGKFDSDMLTYPELEKDDLERLNLNLESTQKYFSNLLPLQQPPDIKGDFMENLRRLKLFGLQGPQTLDARELDVIEDCRFNDVLSSSTSSMMGLLCNDKLVFQSLLKYGTDEIRKKYLSGLISGNSLGAFCVTEPTSNKKSLFNTSATFIEDKKIWVLNGEKAFIVNGSIANILLVLANTNFRNKLGMTESKLTFFVVEREFGGITTQACDALGLQATDIANIKFNNTPIPAENILGEVNTAQEIIPLLLTDFRIATGPACSGILRQLINKTVKFCTDTTVANKSLAEAECVQSVVAHLAIQLYAIESTTYLTSSLMDQYENQDCQLEAIALKIFSTQETCSATLKVMEMLGPSAYMKDHWCNILHRDSLSHLILHEPSENLKLALCLLGLQHIGISVQEKVRKYRNPLFHPTEMFKRLWNTRKQVADEPPLTLKLSDNLHPSLIKAAECLEYSVLRVEYAVECLLIRVGNEVINNHMELIRLADCVIDIYAMTACLGRASRAYCVGLAHADLEMAIAHTFCVSAVDRIKDKINKVCGGPFFSNDENYKKIAENLFKTGEYFPVHPLTRNY